LSGPRTRPSIAQKKRDATAWSRLRIKTRAGYPV
jgi:hypothetical protein